MASPFQQQSLKRKLIYFGAIAVLFCASLLYRKSLVEAKATELELREENLGEVEVAGSAVRIGLSGSRGLVVCAMWYDATEKQKKNQWSELEKVVRNLTKLQPHFLSPWLFQSWNLAYNVSVESDRVRDKYFYITRGIELLAEGERRNHNQPDLRDTIGLYLQNKIGQSDETTTQRCLFALSRIPPQERDPDQFRQRDARGRTVIDEAKLEEFCARHPHLIRRLYEGLHYTKKEQVLQFLADSRKVPSIYEDPRSDDPNPRLRPPEDRFPSLPPRHDLDAGQKPYFWDYPTDDQTDKLGDDFDCFAAALAWYCYAQEALPEIPALGQPDNIPTAHRLKVRRPKYTTALFRTHPPRAQSYIAENLAKEGWFDGKGWLLAGWFPEDKFPSDRQRPAEIGVGTDLASNAWAQAFDLWRKHGEANHLLKSAEELANLRDQAKKYMDKYGMRFGMNPMSVLAEDRDTEIEASARSFAELHWYHYEREMTNFPHFYFRSQLEGRSDVLAARKAFYEADHLRLAGDRFAALKRYESPEAFPVWRTILVSNPEFGADESVQEDTYDMQLQYLRLVKEINGPLYKQLMAVSAALGQAADPASGPTGLALTRMARPRAVPIPDLVGPFDGENKKGEPLISIQSRNTVAARRGLPQVPMTGRMPGEPTPPPSAGDPNLPRPKAVGR